MLNGSEDFVFMLNGSEDFVFIHVWSRSKQTQVGIQILEKKLHKKTGYESYEWVSNQIEFRIRASSDESHDHQLTIRV